MANTYTDAVVVDGGELGVDRVLALAILEQLAEGKERGALEEHFCHDAPGAEYVHGLCDGGVGGRTGLHVGLVEALRGDVAGAPAAGIEEEGKVGRIVEGETGGLVRGKVGEVDPV